MTKLDRCLHWGHHLLRQCSRTAEFDGLCGDHFLSCGVGCPPVRWVWWSPTVVDWFGSRWGTSLDEYGNSSWYVQLPVVGTLVWFGGLRPLSHELVTDRPVEDDTTGHG